MASTFQFSESNTISETVSDGITNLNFGSNDSANLNTTTYPVSTPNASFEKYIRGKFSGTFTEISNIKFWKSVGTLVTGETIKAAANVVFATPSTTPNADSDVPTDVGTALAIQSADSGAVYTITDPGYTKYIRLQTHSTTSTPGGAGNTKTFVMQYDEV